MKTKIFLMVVTIFAALFAVSCEQGTSIDPEIPVEQRKIAAQMISIELEKPTPVDQVVPEITGQTVGQIRHKVNIDGQDWYGFITPQSEVTVESVQNEIREGFLNFTKNIIDKTGDSVFTKEVVLENSMILIDQIKIDSGDSLLVEKLQNAPGWSANLISLSAYESDSISETSANKTSSLYDHPDTGWGFAGQSGGIRYAYSVFKWNGNANPYPPLNSSHSLWPWSWRQTYENSIVLNDYNNNSGVYLYAPTNNLGYPLLRYAGSNLPDPYLDTRFANWLGAFGTPQEIDLAIGTYSAKWIMGNTNYVTYYETYSGTANTDQAKITSQVGHIRKVGTLQIKNPFYIYGEETVRLVNAWNWTIPGYISY